MGRGTAILSVGIATTGLVTYAYFSLASHSLSESDYGQITLLWSAVFITVSVLYRPVEQLLSRTIADRDARGQAGTEHLRVAVRIQLVLALAVRRAGRLFREPIQDELFDGSSTLFWVLVATVLAYAVSYFARGYLAGHRRFGLYGGLVLMESCTRVAFALAVAVGAASGQSAVALGMLAAPVASLAVVPWATRRLADTAAPGAADEPAAEVAGSAEFTLAHGGGFAAAVLVIMLAEQTFLNAGPLVVNATEGAAGAALAGFTFNVLLVARAPLQLFQAVQTSILPHLTRLDARGAGGPLPPQPERDARGHRGIRGGRGARDACRRAGADGAGVRRRLRVRPRRAGADRRRHGPVPGRGHPQPGVAGPRARPGGLRLLGRGRGRVRGDSSCCRASTMPCCRSRSGTRARRWCWPWRSTRVLRADLAGPRDQPG